MSFDIRFHSKDHQAASDQIDKARAPDCIKDFLRQAIKAIREDDGLSVVCYGHLYAEDYDVSSCTIQVTPLRFVKAAHENEE